MPSSTLILPSLVTAVFATAVIAMAVIATAVIAMAVIAIAVIATAVIATAVITTLVPPLVPPVIVPVGATFVPPLVLWPLVTARGLQPLVLLVLFVVTDLLLESAFDCGAVLGVDPLSAVKHEIVYNLCGSAQQSEGLLVWCSKRRGLTESRMLS